MSDITEEEVLEWLKTKVNEDGLEFLYTMARGMVGVLQDMGSVCLQLALHADDPDTPFAAVYVVDGEEETHDILSGFTAIEGTWGAEWITDDDDDKGWEEEEEEREDGEEWKDGQSKL